MHTNNQYRLPAEWELQSGVQLTWPDAQTDWAYMLDDITDTYRQLVTVIERYEPVLTVSADGAHHSTFSAQCPINDTWARDHGFITLVNDSGQAHLLDFKFNGWGEKFAADLDNAINRRLYDGGFLRGQHGGEHCAGGSLHGDYVSHLDFVLEGGSIESDGCGTVFTTTGCLMAPHRNQPLTREQIDRRLRDALGAERIVWINHGALTGDDTDGHIDTLVRICPDDTLVYISCDDPADEQYAELHLMEEELRTLRTLDGRPYRLLRLPMPRPIYDEDHQRLPATHANFLVINGAVLVPTYRQADIDAEALRVIGQAFPGRDIVGIDCCSIIRQHGSLHCCTMQFPQGVIAV